MEVNFCTHFSASYIPQGVALILSIKKHYPNSHIWVMPLDELTRLTLASLHFHNVSLLEKSIDSVLFSKFDEFIQSRTYAESVFSIKSLFIENVLFRLQENEIVFYLDADTFMFSPLELPENLIEISILLSPHYFTVMSSKSANSGNFNAGLVGFKNDHFGRSAVRFWSILCAEWCSVAPDPDRYADQKYLEKIATKWASKIGIFEYGNNFGTWSFSQELSIECKNENIYINGKKITLFHFHGLKISKILIRTGISMYGHFPVENRIKKMVYGEYRMAIKNALEILLRIENVGTYKNKKLFPNVGSFRNFLALARRRDFILMWHLHGFLRKKN